MSEDAPDTERSSLMLRRRFDPDRRVVAVSGAHSFLGQQLLARLHADRRYSRVIAIDIQQPPALQSKAQFFRIDLTQPTADAELARLLQQQHVDTFVHLAFLSRPSHNSSWAHELEAIGTLHVLNACAACDVHKVVLWSLTALYGARPDNPNYVDESSPLRAIRASPFFGDKLEAERLTERFAKENPEAVVTVLRTAPILGRRVNNFVSEYVAQPVVPTMMGYDPLVQLLGEDDAVDAFKLAADADYSGNFNIAADGVLPLGTALALAGKLTLPVPHLLARPLANMLWFSQLMQLPPGFLDFLRFLCVADNQRAKRELGFNAKQDIRQVIAAFADPPAPSAEAA